MPLQKDGWQPGGVWGSKMAKVTFHKCHMGQTGAPSLPDWPAKERVQTLLFFLSFLVWGQTNQKHTPVRTSFKILTSACVIISLIACAAPSSPRKNSSGPQNVLCKRNLPNLVLSLPLVRPVVNYYCPWKRLKLCDPYHFFHGSGLKFSFVGTGF